MVAPWATLVRVGWRVRAPDGTTWTVRRLWLPLSGLAVRRPGGLVLSADGLAQQLDAVDGPLGTASGRPGAVVVVVVAVAGEADCPAPTRARAATWASLGMLVVSMVLLAVVRLGPRWFWDGDCRAPGILAGAAGVRQPWRSGSPGWWAGVVVDRTYVRAYVRSHAEDRGQTMVTDALKRAVLDLT